MWYHRQPRIKKEATNGNDATCLLGRNLNATDSIHVLGHQLQSSLTRYSAIFCLCVAYLAWSTQTK